MKCGNRFFFSIACNIGNCVTVVPLLCSFSVIFLSRECKDCLRYHNMVGGTKNEEFFFVGTDSLHCAIGFFVLVQLSLVDTDTNMYILDEKEFC